MASPQATSNIIVVGADLAGLFLALKLSPRPVTLISPTAIGPDATGGPPQGGLAAAIGPGDSIDSHMSDTIAAGHGMVDEATLRMILSEGPARVGDLVDYGVPFDRDPKGDLVLTREPGHAIARVLHGANGGGGRAIMTALLETVRRTPSITVLEGYDVEELTTDGEGPQRQVTGLSLSRVDDVAARYTISDISAVVLATGGIGALYRTTTCPAHMRGVGLAVGARAGAIVSDAEFVQFHPTAIDCPDDPTPLATEALRSSGAQLVDGNGRAFLDDANGGAEQASRAGATRAVHQQIANGEGVFLDCTRVPDLKIEQRFPDVYRACMMAGIDPSIEPIPVVPAAHFHIGGLKTDADARTNVAGLWAVGEVAACGLHGADRLAGHARLEAVVMAARAADSIARAVPSDTAQPTNNIARGRSPHLPDFGARAAGLAMIRETMSSNVGVERDDARLRQALATLKDIEAAGGDDPAIENATIAARFIAEAALRRRESRGVHLRADYPASDPEQARSRTMTLAGLSLRDSLASGELFSEITAGGGTLH